MKNTLDKVDELLQSLRALLPMQQEYRQKLDKKFRLEFNYNSNHMEGNTLTYGETELLLIFNETNGNHNLREYEEMKGHDVAIELVEYWALEKEHPLTESYIKNLNAVILKEPFWKDAITPDGQATRRLIKPGDYKEHPNSVRLQNGEIFAYASPAETPILMQELIDWYRAEETALHPVTLAALLHYKFVRIHPFDDGNGRIARLLINYVLLKNNFPPIIIKSNDKQNYLRALHLADVGNYEFFIDYIAEQVVWSLEVSIKGAQGGNIEEPDDVDKEIHLFKKGIDKSKERKEIRNFASIKTVLNTSAIPLFQKLISKLSGFNDLFAENENRIIYSDREDIEYDLRERSGGYMLSTAQFPGTAYDWIKRYNPINNAEMKHFGLETYFKGYKMGSPFDLGVLVNIIFGKYTYNIVRNGTFIPDGHYIEKNYDDILNEEEIIYVVNDLAKEILKFLKEK